MLDLQQIAKLTGGIWLKRPVNMQQVVIGGCFDSRIYSGEDIFIALAGLKQDGHSFIKSLLTKPLKLILVSQQVDCEHPQAAYLLVKDTQVALQQIATKIIDIFTGKIVSVTGSSGKTTFQHWLSQVLSQKYIVHNAPNSYNNLIGLCISILGLKADTDIFVCELGSNHLGEIAQLSSIVRSHYAVLLNVGMAHLGHFGSLQNTYLEKQAIFNDMRSPKIAVVPQADKKIKVPKTCNTLFFSSQCIQSAFQAEKLSCSYQLNYAGQLHTFSSQLIGQHVPELISAISLLAAEFDISVVELLSGLSLLHPRPGRMELKQGIHNSLWIDDSYNANPNSLNNLLKTMQSLPQQKKILVLGELAELCDNIDQALQYVLDPLEMLKLDVILSVGQFGQLLEKASTKLNVINFPDKKSLIDKLTTLINQNVVIAVKGSRISKLEDIVNHFVHSAA